MELTRAGPLGLGTSGDEWDLNPLLLPCLNGVLELDTGHFRPGKPDDMIQAHCDAEWHGPDVPCPNFEKFLFEIMDSDFSMVSFLKRLLGYCLSGLTVERILIILHGENGQNGKGTLIELLKKILAKLATEIPAATLLLNAKESTGGAATPDIMLLRFKRLAWCSETNKQKSIDVARCKWVSGGDTVVGRHLHQGFVEFEPTAKIFLLTNHKPKADGMDSALWHRLLLIPFSLTFIQNPKLPHERKRDKHLQDKLILESSGILSWLYQGFREWREKGLQPPEKVLMATKDFRNENDSITQFENDCCLVMAGVRCKPTELYQAYSSFCTDAGLESESMQSFFTVMKSKFQNEKNYRGRWYIGIGLKNEQDKGD